MTLGGLREELKMDYNNFDNFFKNLGFTFNNAEGTEGHSGSGGIGAPFGCNDIPNGFQDMHPELFIVIAELLGNIMAGKLPFNVQNAVGNWLMLVGQAIVTFNAQQQYFQGGPGRYYDVRNKNVTNSFCSSGPDETSQKKSSSEVESLKKDLKELKKEVNDLKIKLENLNE